MKNNSQGSIVRLMRKPHALKIDGSNPSPAIKIIQQATMGAKGIERTYGVIIDGVPKYEFKTKEEIEAFLRGINNDSRI